MKLERLEISLILFAEDLKTTIHPGILQNLGIIPQEWQVVEKPLISDRKVKLVFSHQVSLTMQPDCLIFSETIETQKLDALNIVSIMTAYLKTFTNIQYRAISIVIRDCMNYT